MSDTRFAPTWTGRRGNRGGPNTSDTTTQRFGSRQNRSLMQNDITSSSNNMSSTTIINNHEFSNSRNQIDASSRIIVDSSQSAALSSNDLLAQFQSRRNDSLINNDNFVDPNFLPNFVDPSGSRNRHYDHSSNAAIHTDSSSNGVLNPVVANTILMTTANKKLSRRKKDGLGFMLGVKPLNADEEHRKKMEALSIELTTFLKDNAGRCSTELILAKFNKYIDKNEAKAFKKMLKRLAEVHDGFWHLKH